MFLYKYTHGEDTFYRVTRNKGKIKGSILFGKPVGPISVSGPIETYLSNIRDTFKEVPEEKEETTEETKKMASSIIHRFLQG